MESLVRFGFHKAEKESGLKFNYEKGRFAFNKMELDNLQVYKGSSLLFSFPDASAEIKPLKIHALCQDNNGGSIDVKSTMSEAEFTLKDFRAVTEGTKYFKKIILSGNLQYHLKRNNGRGNLRIKLEDSLDPALINTDILAAADVRITPEIINLSFSDIQGNQLRGSGNVAIIPNNKNFETSPIEGEIIVRTPMSRMTLNITGTVGNIQASPVFGSSAKNDKDKV